MGQRMTQALQSPFLTQWIQEIQIVLAAKYKEIATRWIPSTKKQQPL